MKKFKSQKCKRFLFYSEKSSLVLRCYLIVLFAMLGFTQSVRAQSMVIDNLTGPITQNEIDKFKAYINSKVMPPTYSGDNVYIFGSAGMAMESYGLMYEATGDIEILNKMIYYSDICLAGRNDLAPPSVGGQRVTWTGNVEPVWTSSTQDEIVIQAGVEVGGTLSRLLHCAKLILKNPSIWDNTVPDGNPQGYGITYKQRALKYITEADYVMDNWILPHFLKTTENNHFYNRVSPNTYKPSPWNQLFMLTDGFIRLIQCHVLLNDNPARVAQFDAIVQSNIDWFISSTTDKNSLSGSATKLFSYALGEQVEDVNHFSLDVHGLWIAYYSKRYTLSFKDMVPFANTYVDVILANYNSATGKYAGRIDGTSTTTGKTAGDSYVRDQFIYLTEFRSDQYIRFATINNGILATSPIIIARLLWEKNRRYINSQTNLTELPEQTVVITPGHKNRKVLFGDVTLNWTGSINTASYHVYLGTSANNMQDKGVIISQTLLVPALLVNTKYFWRVDATNNVGTVTGEVYYFTTSEPDNLPPDPTASQTRITGDGGKMTAQFSGSGSGGVPVGNHIPALVDLNTDTKFYIGGKTALWFQYEPLVPSPLLTYKIASGGDVPGRDPKSWNVKGSNDGVNWVLLDNQVDEMFVARQQTKFYIVNDETKYKYFRLYITQNAGNVNSQLSEWNIYYSNDPTASQTRVTADGGEMTAQFSGSASGGIPVGNHIPALVDLNTATKFYISAKTALWFQYEPLVASALSTYKISSGGDVPGRDPKSWNVKGSNDGVNWVLLDERSVETFSARQQTKFYVVDDDTKYKYFRLYITQNAGDVNSQLSEWNIYESKTLPVELISFEAIKRTDGVQLKWQTASEQNNSYFIIYRAGDDQQFQPLSQVMGKGDSEQLQVYSLMDKNPLKGNNYYKLVQFDFNGVPTEKGIRVVDFELTKPDMLVYPNPLIGNIIYLNYANERGTFNVKIQDLMGKTIFEKDFIGGESQDRYRIDLNFKPNKGVYLLTVTSRNNTTAVAKFLVE